MSGRGLLFYEKSIKDVHRFVMRFMLAREDIMSWSHTMWSGLDEERRQQHKDYQALVGLTADHMKRVMRVVDEYDFGCRRGKVYLEDLFAHGEVSVLKYIEKGAT